MGDNEEDPVSCERGGVLGWRRGYTLKPIDCVSDQSGPIKLLCDLTSRRLGEPAAAFSLYLWRLSANHYFHLCHWSTHLLRFALCLCVWSVWLSAVGGRHRHSKSISGCEISRLLFHTISRLFCRFLKTSVSAWLYLADLSIGLLGTGWQLRVAVEIETQKAAECFSAHL